MFTIIMRVKEFHLIPFTLLLYSKNRKLTITMTIPKKIFQIQYFLLNFSLFLRYGDQLQMRFSQSFLDEIIKFLCSLESPFQVVLKNIPTFYDRTHMTKVMADKSLSTIFFETPCIFCRIFFKFWVEKRLKENVYIVSFFKWFLAPKGA